MVKRTHKRSGGVRTIEFEHRKLNWVQSFVREFPSEKAILAEFKIKDEKSYLKSESKLPTAFRHKIGVYRTHRITGSQNEDPCLLARYCPPWLGAEVLEHMNLPVRILHVFEKHKMRTVSDLANLTLKQLLKVSKIDKRASQDIFDALNKVLARGPRGGVTIVRGVDIEATGLIMGIRNAISKFPDKNREILERRLGIYGPYQSLQEIGRNYGVTRERVRQIEAKSLNRLIAETNLEKILNDKLTQAVKGSSKPIKVEYLSSIDPWFDEISTHSEFLKNLVGVICKKKINIIKVNGEHYVSLLTPEQWNKTVKGAKKLIAAHTGKFLDEKSVKEKVSALLGPKAKELSQLLWEVSSKSSHFIETEEGTKILASYGVGTEHCIEAILTESDTPLHYTEVARLASEKLNKYIDTRTAHNAVAKVGMLFGSGIFGLMKHVPLTKREITAVRTEVEKMISSQSGNRQWHSSEILSKLPGRMKKVPENLDKYIIDIALKDSRKLEYLGRMTWSLASGKKKRSKRIMIQDQIIFVLKNAKRPLSTKELTKRLTTSRGLNETFQIVPRGDLIRLETGLWGIKGRDGEKTRKTARSRGRRKAG